MFSTQAIVLESERRSARSVQRVVDDAQARTSAAEPSGIGRKPAVRHAISYVT
jgi:hypothetical protein